MMVSRAPRKPPPRLDHRRYEHDRDIPSLLCGDGQCVKFLCCFGIPSLLFIILSYASPRHRTLELDNSLDETNQQISGTSGEWNEKTRAALKEFENLDFLDSLNDLRNRYPTESKDPYFIQDRLGEVLVRHCSVSLWKLVDTKLLSRKATTEAERVCLQAQTLVKTVNLTEVASGSQAGLSDVQTQKLGQIMSKVKHDAFSVGFHIDSTKSPGIPPIPEAPPSPSPPPLPPVPPLTVPNAPPLLTAPDFPPGHVLNSQEASALLANAIGDNLLDRISPPPNAPFLYPPPPPYLPMAPRASPPPLSPSHPAPPDFTTNCTRNKEVAIANTLRLKYCLFHTQPAGPGDNLALRRYRRSLLQSQGVRATLPEAVAASFLKDHAKDPAANSAVLGIRTGDAKDLKNNDGNKCRFVVINAPSARLAVFVAATSAALGMPCDVNVYEDDEQRQIIIKKRLGTNHQIKVPVKVIAKKVREHIGQEQTTMDLLLCEPTLAGSENRTAVSIPFCQLGDTPLVMLAASSPTLEVIKGMGGALATKYPAAVVWELHPDRAGELKAHIQLFKKFEYAVYLAFKDDSMMHQRRVEPDLLRVDTSEVVEREVMRMVHQYEIVPVFMAVRLGHPFIDRARSSLVKCDPSIRCIPTADGLGRGMCAVPVDCACLIDGSPTCRTEELFVSGRKPETVAWTGGLRGEKVTSVEPHSFIP